MSGVEGSGLVRTYGARPVSVDIARGQHLAEAAASPASPQSSASSTGALSHQVVADRLSLAHWPAGHQIVFCGLSGGSGRTTLAGLLATVLAEQPFAHLWAPIALAEAEPRTLSSTARRWSLIEPPDPDVATMTAAGAWAFTTGQQTLCRNDFSAVVVDAPAGLPSDLPAVQDDPKASIVLLARPDRASLADAADALVWMNDQSLVSRSRVTVVINHGAGRTEAGGRAAAAALGIRCAAIHSLAASSALGPAKALPSGRDMPVAIRRLVSRVAFDVWSRASTNRFPSACNSQPGECQ